MHTSQTAAIVVYQGVHVDEAAVIRSVLSRLPDVHTVTVSSSRGTFAGPGGTETAETTLAEIGNPDIVAVPGGIACHQRTDISDWLTTISPSWILASSTGTTLLAAAGLLRDATAATHWLAGPLLEGYGAHLSQEPVVVDGPIITCSGAASVFRGALVIAEAYGGRDLVDRIRASAIRTADDPEPPQAFWARLWDALWPSRHSLSDRQPAEDSLELDDVLDLGSYVLPPGGEGPGRGRP